MARLTQRLTAVEVINLRNEGLHPDGDGLYLRVTKTGTKSWIFRFAQDGTTRDIGLGPLKDVSLASARRLSADARRRLLEGADPIEARKVEHVSRKLKEARGTTFKSAAEQMITSREAGWRNPKHRQQWRNTLRTYVYPVLGHLPVD